MRMKFLLDLVSNQRTQSIVYFSLRHDCDFFRINGHTWRNSQRRKRRSDVKSPSNIHKSPCGLSAGSLSFKCTNKIDIFSRHHPRLCPRKKKSSLVSLNVNFAGGNISSKYQKFYFLFLILLHGNLRANVYKQKSLIIWETFLRALDHVGIESSQRFTQADNKGNCAIGFGSKILLVYIYRSQQMSTAEDGNKKHRQNVAKPHKASFLPSSLLIHCFRNRKQSENRTHNNTIMCTRFSSDGFALSLRVLPSS